MDQLRPTALRAGLVGPSDRPDGRPSGGGPPGAPVALLGTRAGSPLLCSRPPRGCLVPLASGGRDRRGRSLGPGSVRLAGCAGRRAGAGGVPTRPRGGPGDPVSDPAQSHPSPVGHSRCDPTGSRRTGFDSFLAATQRAATKKDPRVVSQAVSLARAGGKPDACPTGGARFTCSVAAGTSRSPGSDGRHLPPDGVVLRPLPAPRSAPPAKRTAPRFGGIA